jgi:hypothetical protein
MGRSSQARQERGDNSRKEAVRLKDLAKGPTTLTVSKSPPPPKPVPVQSSAPVLPEWDPLAEVAEVELRRFEAEVIFCKNGQYAMLEEKISRVKVYLPKKFLSGKYIPYLPPKTVVEGKAFLHPNGWRTAEVISIEFAG